MATLSLKKPARTGVPIDRKPLQDLGGRYAVMRQSRNSKAMRFTCTHETKEQATAEAARLCAKRPDSRFLVLHVIDGLGG